MGNKLPLRIATGLAATVIPLFGSAAISKALRKHGDNVLGAPSKRLPLREVAKPYQDLIDAKKLRIADFDRAHAYKANHWLHPDLDPEEWEHDMGYVYPDWDPEDLDGEVPVNSVEVRAVRDNKGNVDSFHVARALGRASQGLGLSEAQFQKKLRRKAKELGYLDPDAVPEALLFQDSIKHPEITKRVNAYQRSHRLATAMDVAAPFLSVASLAASAFLLDRYGK